MLQKHLSAETGSRGNGIAAGKGGLAYLTTGKGAREAQLSCEQCVKPPLPPQLTLYGQTGRWTVSNPPFSSNRASS